MVITENVGRQWFPVRKWSEANPDFGRLNFVYEAIARGELLSVKVGSKLLVASDALDVLAARQNSNED